MLINETRRAEIKIFLCYITYDEGFANTIQDALDSLERRSSGVFGAQSYAPPPVRLDRLYGTDGGPLFALCSDNLTVPINFLHLQLILLPVQSQYN